MQHRSELRMCTSPARTAPVTPRYAPLHAGRCTWRCIQGCVYGVYAGMYTVLPKETAGYRRYTPLYTASTPFPPLLHRFLLFYAFSCFTACSVLPRVPGLPRVPVFYRVSLVYRCFTSLCVSFRYVLLLVRKLPLCLLLVRKLRVY